MKSKPTLFLLPNLLDQESSIDLLPSALFNIVNSLDGLIAESEKRARAYLLRFLSKEQANLLPVNILSEHTTDIKGLLEPVLLNQKWGMISDCGLPILADPGSDLIFLARKYCVQIEVLMGPSAIILALMLSGFSGQKFAFYGYLPIKKSELMRKLHFLEKRAKRDKATQIWIETPYRASKMLEVVIHTLEDKMQLCVAENLTTVSQRITTLPIYLWKKEKVNLGKCQTVFLLSS